MVIEVGLQKVDQRPRIRLKNHRVRRCLSPKPMFQSDIEEPTENGTTSPILISRIISSNAAISAPESLPKPKTLESATNKTGSIKLLDRITETKHAFWVIPNRLLVTTIASTDSLPAALQHAQITVIARLSSKIRERSLKTVSHRPIRYRTSARVVNFSIDPRNNSLATILSDISNQIVKILDNEDEVVLLQCPDNDGWDLAISALLLAGSTGTSIADAISRLRMLCNAIDKRWTMDLHTESVLLHQLQQIPYVMSFISEANHNTSQISLGSAKKVNSGRRFARPILVALRPQSTRVIVAKPFQPVEVRRLVSARESSSEN